MRKDEEWKVRYEGLNVGIIMLCAMLVWLSVIMANPNPANGVGMIGTKTEGWECDAGGEHV